MQISEVLPETLDAVPERAVNTSWGLSSLEASVSAEKQKLFFKAIDKSHLHVEGIWTTSATHRSREPYTMALAAAMAKLPETYAKSPTVVMEAAFFLLREGLLNIPDIGRINVKQARAFLWNAAWLQDYMTTVWSEESTMNVNRSRLPERRFEDFCLAIVGPGGTGKTAVLSYLLQIYLSAHAQSARSCHSCCFVCFSSVVGLVVVALVVVVVVVLVVVVAFWRYCCRALFRGFFRLLLVSFDVSGHLWTSLWGPLGSRVGPCGLFRLGVVLRYPWRLLGIPWVACGSRRCFWRWSGGRLWGAKASTESSWGIPWGAPELLFGNLGAQ